MRHAIALAVAALLCGGGCAEYQQSKIDLAEQARRGVALARDAAEARQGSLDAVDVRQRKELDDAFDADVFARGPAGLTPTWVVAHRKAYAAAVDAMAQQRRAAEQSRERTLSNLATVDAALQQLQRMQQQEQTLTRTEGTK